MDTVDRRPSLQVGANDVVARMGAPDDSDYRRAASLLERIPPELLDRARSVDRVVPLCLGLLFSSDPPVRAKQHGDLRVLFGPPLAQAALEEADAVSRLDRALWLPLAEIAFPALRHRPASEQEAVLGAVHTLIHADDRISTFEYCFSALLRSELYESMNPAPPWRSEKRTLRASRDEVVTLLAVLATDQRAFQAGLSIALPGYTMPFLPREVIELEPVWSVLRELAPDGKERLVQAAVEVIGYDAVMTIDEIELLRTVCSLLHCPLPPLVGGEPGSHNL